MCIWCSEQLQRKILVVVGGHKMAGRIRYLMQNELKKAVDNLIDGLTDEEECCKYWGPWRSPRVWDLGLVRGPGTSVWYKMQLSRLEFLFFVSRLDLDLLEGIRGGRWSSWYGQMYRYFTSILSHHYFHEVLFHVS